MLVQAAFICRIDLAQFHAYLFISSRRQMRLVRTYRGGLRDWTYVWNLHLEICMCLLNARPLEPFSVNIRAFSIEFAAMP